MFKKTKILALGLSMAVLTAQTARAELLITPLDVTKVTEQNGGAGAQASQGAQVSEGVQTSQETAEAGKTSDTTELSVPEISAEAGILYDVTHDQVLFEKNADEKLYPASITKLMTALLVLEKADMNGQVTFSKTAVTDLESGAVTLKLQEGDQVSVRDCLYGLMLKSANEVANGLAEHVGGSIAGFCDMMNARAKELGCTNTNFANPNGLNDPDHYTTCRDMAKIAAAAFSNSEFCKISSTLSYEFPATKAAGARTITPGHKMLYPTDSRYYEGIVGGKTGYTSLAGNTLVTCVEKDGVRMIAVILKSKSTHYTDTKAILDYGFEKMKTTQETQGQGTQGQGPQSQGDQAAASGQDRWIFEGSAWRFEMADGTRLSGCMAIIDGVTYGFDSEGKMVTGWQKYSDSWYYFDSDGSMAKNVWREDGGKWFYLGSDGTIIKNTWIDNTYYVGADGVWVTQ